MMCSEERGRGDELGAKNEDRRIQLFMITHGQITDALMLGFNETF